MDHLPRSHDSPWPIIEIPIYTCPARSYIYSPPWNTYAKRQDYHIDSELYVHDEDNYDENLKPQLAVFVQSWLYFGLLTEFLHGSRLPASTWIAEGVDGRKVVTTAKLLPELDRWCERLRSFDSVTANGEISRVDRLIYNVNSEFGRFEFSLTDVFRVHDLLPWQLCLSIHTLMATLTIARNVAATKMGWEPVEEPAVRNYDFVADRMRRDGWCPSEIERVRRDCHSIISRHCVSGLGPVQKELDHSACEMGRCMVAQIDHATYRTRHFDPDCPCMMTENVSGQVAQILRGGHTPVLRWNEHLGHVELSMAEDDAGYVAISHVWSDGLGNLTQNCLPICQVRRLQHQVDALYQDLCTDEDVAPTAFWIDTICVPVGMDFVAERDLAIAGMKDVYEKADKVLVLNAEIAGIDSCRSAWELSARINRTSWFRRLWTLHEGVLARRLLFQLADRAVEMENLERGPQTTIKTGLVEESMYRIMFEEANSVYTAMQRFKALPRVERSKEIWSAVHSRSTSNREDETVCLSNMLGLDLAPILAIDRKDPEVCEKRMQAFILHQKLFPQSSLFSVGDEIAPQNTLSQPGFRWAPKSFVFRHGDVGPSKEDTLARATDAGLCVQYPGIVPGGSWKEFLNQVRFTTELEEEVFDQAIAHKMPEVLFMLPLQWDVYYSFTWDIEEKWPLTNEILETTKPLIILQEDLPNIDIDARTLVYENRRVREFYFDIPDGCDDLDESMVLKRICPAVVVAAPLAQTVPVRPDSKVDPVMLLASGRVSKDMFGRSDSPAWDQLWFPDKTTAVRKFGTFSSLPVSTSWCVG